MKRFSEQLKKKSDTVRMSAVERRELRARLVSYMEYHPLPHSKPQKNAAAYLNAEQKFSFLNFNTPHVRGFMTMFAAFVLIVVPVVAEKSVPGDMLYPVKVHFTEEIRSQLAVSPYAKIELETRLMERRIAEARLLADEGKLTPEVEEGVAAAVKTHSDAAQSEIASLRESDSDEAAIAEIAFGSALSVQSEVLEGTLKKAAFASGATTTEGAPVAALALVVDAARKDVEEKQSLQTPSFEKLMARIESESTRAFELFADVKEVATPEEVTDVERRLSDIERKINDAIALHDVFLAAPEEQEGSIAPRADVALMRTVLGDLQKLISFMTDIDVRENVTVEALVPVTLTNEEQAAAITTHMKANESRMEAAQNAFSLYEGDKTEKIAVGLAQVAALASSTEAALDAGDLAAAKRFAEDASAYLIDVETLLAGIKVPKGTPIVEPDKASSTDAVETDGEDGRIETGMGVDGERATATIDTERIFE